MNVFTMNFRCELKQRALIRGVSYMISIMSFVKHGKSYYTTKRKNVHSVHISKNKKSNLKKSL